MSQYLRTIFKMFKENLGRFFANTLIVFVAMVISAGLGALTQITLDSYSAELNRLNAPDLIVKSTSASGFTAEQLDELYDIDDIENVDGYFAMDLPLKGSMTRVYCMPLENRAINKVELLEGSYPSAVNEVAVEWANSERTPYAPGDTINLTMDLGSISLGLNLKVSGVVKSSLYFCQAGEPSQSDQDVDVDRIVYLSPKIFNLGILPVTDVAISFNGESAYFNDDYDEEASNRASEITSLIGSDNCAVLTMKENYSYRMMVEAMEKIDILAILFTVFFGVITVLVNFITIKRLVEDERAKIGCCTSLGVPFWKLHLKYLSFAVVSVVVGCLLGLIVGPYLISYVCYIAVGTMFVNPPIVWNFASLFGIFMSIGLIVCSIIEAVVQVALSLHEVPSALLQRKSPKPGKKIWLEHIKPLWRVLPFRYKSSFRNIFRRKVHLTLTILSVAFSTALVFVGMALMDVSQGLNDDPLYHSLSSTMVPISLLVIICAMALAVLIVYNLVDMNIAERVREIATLKVLGYTDHECSLYTGREILIMTSMGMILGLPCGYLMAFLVFRSLDFGNMADIQWYSYIVPLLLIMVTALAVNLLLSLKVKKIDMNDSLKTLD